jgi:L-arabinose isomerase
MIDLKQYKVWFVTGSQHLYGPKTLERFVLSHNKRLLIRGMTLENSRNEKQLSPLSSGSRVDNLTCPHLEIETSH